MTSSASGGIRIEHHGEALARLPLPPTQTWTGGAWNADVLTLTSARLSLFAPRGTAFRTTYDQDELYLIVSGSAIVAAGSESYAVDGGDAIFVPAGTEHQFTRLTDDLSAWMVWLPIPELDLRDVAREFMNGWITHDRPALKRTMSEDCVFVDSAGQIFAGSDAAQSGLLQFPPADPRYARVEIGDPTVMHDRGLVEWTVFRTDGSLVAHGATLLTFDANLVSRCDSFRKVLPGRLWPPWPAAAGR